MIETRAYLIDGARKCRMKNSITGMSLPIVISDLQSLMNLHHWRIEYVKDAPPSTPGALLEIRTIRPRNVARLYISEPFWEEEKASQVERLKHELFHLVLDNMWEEHEFQIHHGVESSVQRGEYRARFVRVMEKAVEHLSRMPLVAAEGRIW